MPLMTGVECTKKFREFDEETPVVAFTANAFEEDLAQCYDSGMVNPLIEPSF